MFGGCPARRDPHRVARVGPDLFVSMLFAKISARVFEIFPKPLLTSDQLRLLKYDNLPSGKYKTNLDFGFQKNLKFDVEVQKYSYMWRDEGEYSKNEKTMHKEKK